MRRLLKWLLQFDYIIFWFFFATFIYGVSYISIIHFQGKKTIVSTNVKTPLDSCVDSIRLAVARNDKNFKLVCIYEGTLVEVGQVKEEMEMPELMADQRF